MAVLENEPTFWSGGNASAGFDVSPSRSRTVLLYSARVNRRSGATPGDGVVHTALACAPECESRLASGARMSLPSAPIEPTQAPAAIAATPAIATMPDPPTARSGVGHGRRPRTMSDLKRQRSDAVELKVRRDAQRTANCRAGVTLKPFERRRRADEGRQAHAVSSGVSGPAEGPSRASEHAPDAARVDRDLVDPELEGLGARLVLLPSEPYAGKLRQPIRVRVPAVHRQRRRERRVRRRVPPELRIARVALVHPLEANPLAGRHRAGRAVRVVVRSRPIPGPAVGAVVGADAEEVPSVLELSAHADLAGHPRSAGRDHRPVRVRHAG